MASPLFCHCFLNDFGFNLLFGIHFSATAILFEFFETPHECSIHPATLFPSFIEAGAADAMFRAQSGNRCPHNSLCENGDYPTASKP
jgi:hypothetical protein